MGEYNPYAAPDAAIEVSAHGSGARRVGGWFRFFVLLVENAPLVALVALFESGPTRDRVSAASSLVLTALFVATEVTLAASPGMLLFGLRVARADGRPANRSDLVKKALLVRVATFVMLPQTFARLLGRSLTAPRQPDGAIPATPWQWTVFIVTLLWVVAFLPAFGRGKQTLYDRILGLAVFRRRDLSTTPSSVL
jgi:uncharacterized RDD family membrane protein YckC